MVGARGIKVIVLIASGLLFGNSVAPKAWGDQYLALTRYGNIDVEPQYRAIKILQGQDSPTRTSLIEHIRTHPEKYTPAVLYVLSAQLFDAGRRTEGMYWYYGAQLRTRYDVNRCLDETARATLKALNQAYGKEIEQYAQNNVATFRQIIAEAVRFEHNTAHRYDHRWINLHGMRVARAVVAAQSGLSLNEPLAMTRPEEEWESIRRHTVQRFKEEMEQQARDWTSGR